MITFSGKQMAEIYAGEKNLEGEKATPRDMEMTVIYSQQMKHPARKNKLADGDIAFFKHYAMQRTKITPETLIH